MIKYFRKNQKKAMAIFGILLMIAFALPIGFGQMGRGGGGDRPAGTLLGQTLTYNDSVRFKNEWRALRDHYGPVGLALALGSVPTGESALVVQGLTNARLRQAASEIVRNYGPTPQLWQILSQSQPPQMRAIGDAAYLGIGIFEQIESNEDAFMLLVKEAEANGIGADEETVTAILAAEMNGQAPPEAGTPEGRDYQNRRALLRDFLKVINSARRAATVAKVSQPLRSYLMGTQAQQLSVNVVEFDAKDFLVQVPAPTEDEVKAHFDKYKDKDAKADETPFGYKIPNRAKFDAIVISADEVKKAIKPVQGEDVAEYYYANKGTPAIPTTRETFSLGDGTRPKTLAESADEIRERLTTERVTALTTAVRDAVRTTLRADFDAYKAAVDAKKPVPTSSLGVPYNTFEYLQKLRDKVQADHKVTLTISDVGTFLTADAMKDTVDFKDLMVTAGERGRTPFGQYLTTALDAYLTDDERKALGQAADQRPSLWQPLPAAEDVGGKKQVIARATAAEPAHAPAKLDDVREQVVADVKKAKAYQLAKAAAEKALASVQSGQWLQSVANELNKPMITTGAFRAPGGESPMFGDSVPNYPLGTQSTRPFKRAAFALLSQPARTGEAPPPPRRPATAPATTAAADKPKPTDPKTTDPKATATATKPAATTQASTPVVAAFKGHPAGLVELPADGKVAVIEVDKLIPGWDQRSVSAQEMNTTMRQNLQSAGLIAQDWFLYENVTARTAFTPADDRAPRRPANNRPNSPNSANPNPFIP